MADVAAATVDEFARRVELEATKLLADDGLDRLTRQRAATRRSTWVDAEGMWNAELAGDADLSTVVVRNGVVLYAPGELNLGRTTRLANRAQRRALRALYSSCAIPGCTGAYDRCKLHHVPAA